MFAIGMFTYLNKTAAKIYYKHTFERTVIATFGIIIHDHACSCHAWMLVTLPYCNSAVSMITQNFVVVSCGLDQSDDKH